MDDAAGANAAFPGSELILGGQKSGKSRRAEECAARWLAAAPHHRAVLIATARAGDDEMRRRIARHRQDRLVRLPRLQTVEEPVELAHAISHHANDGTLIVVDCLTLWLANLLAPLPDDAMPQPEITQKVPFFEENRAPAQWIRAQAAIESIANSLVGHSAGPLVFVSNEIGLGVVPMGALSRDFVDALGLVNQRLAASCERVTFMAAGLPMCLKGAP